MPLPANGTPWPPRELKNILPAMHTWDAWWTGTADALQAAYSQIRDLPPGIRPSQYSGGIIGTVSRWFWGTPPAMNGQTKHRLHVPIAADICQASADLLFAEAPRVIADDEQTQTRLDELVDDGMLTVFAEAAEIGAALSGSFLRVTWDTTERPEAPFLTCVHADAALPVFGWGGKLLQVTFWWVIKADGQQIWRHLEHHELSPDGVGLIQHGLYRGSTTDLGIAVPLTDLPATSNLATVVDQDGYVTTGTPGLAVAYLPNQRPQRRWRKDPLGTHLGRSDLDGIEPLMDSLDEAWTALMRDVRLGKARIFASKELLSDLGAGQGAYFDADQEIFTQMGTAAGSLNPNATSGAAKSLIDHFQPDVRAEAHLRVIDRLISEIVSKAGYSGATFGQDNGNTATSNGKTATEVTADQQRSYLTRDRKIRLIGPRIAEVLEKLLAVDQSLFGSKVTVQRPDVQFADGVQDSILTLAQTAQALFASESASTRTRVGIIHPDWDDDAVDEEVQLIKDEAAAAVPPMLDPMGGTVPDGGPGSVPGGGPGQGVTGGNPAGATA